MSRFFKTDYFQKSKHFLYSLIGDRGTASLINTYLYADDIDEDITTNNILVEGDLKNSTELEKRLISSYKLENGNALNVFSLDYWENEVQLFLQGKYSKYSENAKNRILFFHKYYENLFQKRKHEDIIKMGGNLNIYTYLYPDRMKEILLKEDDFIKSLDKKVVRELEELCDIYNKDKETLKVKIC